MKKFSTFLTMLISASNFLAIEQAAFIFLITYVPTASAMHDAGDEKDPLVDRPVSLADSQNNRAIGNVSDLQTLTPRDFTEENSISFCCRAFPYVAGVGSLLVGMYIGAHYLAHESACLQ